MAEEARISMPYLSEIERGRKEPSSEVLAAAAHALGLTLADLLNLAQSELGRYLEASSPTPRRPGQDSTDATPRSDASATPPIKACLPSQQPTMALAA